MIKETKDNLFNSNAKALVNAVNCVGVMGKGIALQFKQNFPAEYFKFPTKRHWREPSKIEYIESGLQSLVEAIEQYEIKSIAIPALGCGLGGLDYKEVKSLIERTFVDLANVKVLLYLRK